MGCTLYRLICVDSHKMDDWEALAEHEHAMKEFGATDQSACSVDLHFSLISVYAGSVQRHVTFRPRVLCASRFRYPDRWRSFFPKDANLGLQSQSSVQLCVCIKE